MINIFSWFKLKEQGIGYELYRKVKRDPYNCTFISERFYINGLDYIFYIPQMILPYFDSSSKYSKKFTARDGKWIKKAYNFWIDWTVEYVDDELIKSGIERYREEIKQKVKDHTREVLASIGVR